MILADAQVPEALASGRSRSLSVRRAALVWMTVLLTLVGIFGASAAYLIDLGQADGLLDSQLRQIAINAGPPLDQPWPHPGSPLVAAREDTQDSVLVQIWDAESRRIYSNDPRTDIPQIGRPGIATQRAQDGESWRSYALLRDGLTVQASQRVSVRTQLARTAAMEAAVPILITIPLGWLVIGWGLQRILGRLAVVAEGLAARGVNSRHSIPVADLPLEVLPLVRAMNLLIRRLQSSIEQQKRFVSDAAHELRTPLAALRLQIDNLRPARGEMDIEAARAELARGADRAAALVDQLLRLARYDASDHRAEAKPLDVVPLVLDCIADHLQIAEGKQVDLGVTASEPARIKGNERDLKILIGNLIQNAVRYTPSGGIVDVAVKSIDGTLVIEVSDTGCGIRDDLLPRVFDRFFRAAPPDIEGTGLGLSICRAIAERDGLTITLANRRDRPGLVATVTAPILPGRASPAQAGAAKWVPA